LSAIGDGKSRKAEAWSAEYNNIIMEVEPVINIEEINIIV